MKENEHEIKTYLPPPRTAASQRLRLGACVGVIAVSAAASCRAVHVVMVKLWSDALIPSVLLHHHYWHGAQCAERPSVEIFGRGNGIPESSPRTLGFGQTNRRNHTYIRHLIQL